MIQVIAYTAVIAVTIMVFGYLGGYIGTISVAYVIWMTGRTMFGREKTISFKEFYREMFGFAVKKTEDESC